MFGFLLFAPGLVYLFIYLFSLAKGATWISLGKDFLTHVWIKIQSAQLLLVCWYLHSQDYVRMWDHSYSCILVKYLYELC